MIRLFVFEGLYMIQLLRFIRIGLILKKSRALSSGDILLGVHNYTTFLTFEWREDANKIADSDFDG